MKILFSPSETKRSGGTQSFRLETLLFESLLPGRNTLLHRYMNILQKRDLAELSALFGLKKESDILSHLKDIIHEPAMKAIERYSGTAFEYLDYLHLNPKAQCYIDTHVILFSNLLGPIKADDFIPEYKLKQGSAIGDIRPEKFYQEHSTTLMENFLQEEEVLDLRAGFYDKFYTPQKAYTTLKFIKEGKVVSHWAKAYRGIALREAAKAGVESLEDFTKLPIEGLALQEIQTKKNKTEILYTIG